MKTPAYALALILLTMSLAGCASDDDQPNPPQGAYWSGYGEYIGDLYFEDDGSAHIITADGINMTNDDCYDSMYYGSSSLTLLKQEGAVCHWAAWYTVTWELNESHPIDGAYEIKISMDGYSETNNCFAGSDYLVCAAPSNNPNVLGCSLAVKGDPPVDLKYDEDAEINIKWNQDFYDDTFEQVSSEPSKFGCWTFDWASLNDA